MQPTALKLHELICLSKHYKLPNLNGIASTVFEIMRVKDFGNSKAFVILKKSQKSVIVPTVARSRPEVVRGNEEPVVKI
jgi:hypothetical protein